MPYKPGDNLSVSFVTQDATGAATNADAAPVGTLRRNGSNSAQTVTVTNNAAGDYSASASIPITWSGGDRLEMLISATVKGIAGKAVFGLGVLERAGQDAARALLGTGGTVWFVSTAGGDTSDGKSWDTSFATIAKAITVATAGDVIVVGPGTFALGNAVLNLPDRVSLIGAGSKRTTITSTAVLSALGCIVKPGSNCTIAKLGIVAAGSSVFQGCFGFHTGASTPQTSASNWTLEDVYLEGDTDGIYLRDVSSTPAQVRGTVRNCAIRTKFDALTVIGLSGTAWDAIVDVTGFNDFRAIGPSIAGAGSGTSRCLSILTGAIRLFGGYYEASGSATENYCLAIRDGLGDATARIECYGGTLVSSGTNALDAYNNGGAIVLAAAQYDPTKTSGSITLRAVPINKAGQIDAVAIPAVTLALNQVYNNTGQTTPLPTTGGGGGAGFAGPNAVTLAFKDNANNPVPNVVFTVVGVGSATTDATGVKTVNLPTGTYTVRATPTSGVLFTDTAINVTTNATFTITGAATAISPAPSPGQTTAFLTTRDGQGNPLPGVTLTFQLIDPQLATDSYDQTSFTAASDVSALLQVPLLKSTKYQARVGGGAWVPFTTGAAASFALPEVLGTYAA